MTEIVSTKDKKLVRIESLQMIEDGSKPSLISFLKDLSLTIGKFEELIPILTEVLELSLHYHAKRYSDVLKKLEDYRVKIVEIEKDMDLLIFTRDHLISSHSTSLIIIDAGKYISGRIDFLESKMEFVKKRIDGLVQEKDELYLDMEHLMVALVIVDGDDGGLKGTGREKLKKIGLKIGSSLAEKLLSGIGLKYGFMAVL